MSHLNAAAELMIQQKLKAFQTAARELLATWEEVDHTGELLVSDYPFDSCFYDIVHSINQWVETQQNTGQ